MGISSIRSMWVWLFVTSGLAFPFTVLGQDRPILALFDMEDRGSGMGPQVLSNLTELLAIYLAEGGYQVIPRDQVRARLREQQKESQKPCYEQSCQVEMGRELAAQKSVSTQIIKMGGTCHLTAALMDLRRAATEKAASAKAECGEKELGAAIEEIAKKLTTGVQSIGPVGSSPQPAQDELKLREEKKRMEAARKAEEARKRQVVLAAKAEEDRRRQEEARLQEELQKNEERKRSELQARLEPPREVAPPRTTTDNGRPEVTATSASEQRGLSMNTWGHLAFWTGVGATVVAIPAIVLAKGAGDDYAGNPTKDTRAKVRLWTGVMWGSIGAGALLIGTGLTIWFLDKGNSGERTAFSLVPLTDGSTVACTIAGSW